MEYFFWSFLWGALYGKLSHPSGVYQVQFPEEVLSGASALFHLDWLPSRPGVYRQPVLLLTILRGPSAPLPYWTPSSYLPFLGYSIVLVEHILIWLPQIWYMDG